MNSQRSCEAGGYSRHLGYDICIFDLPFSWNVGCIWHFNIVSTTVGHGHPRGARVFQESAGWVLEAERKQQKQPVEITASKEAVSALLDYIYDGQPEVPVEVALELLRLAGAYDLPQLAGAIEAGICACLDSSVALQVLPEAYGLHSLRAECEEKVDEVF